MNLEAIRQVRQKNKAGKVIAVLKADPEGFIEMSGGLIVCGRCGCAVVREFSGNHFKVCRYLWNQIRDRRIIVPGEE